MGGQLIYEYPEEICFNLSSATKEAKVSEYCDNLDWEYNLKDLADFIFENRKTFYDNIVNYDYNYSGIKITKGSKLIKSFKYFIKDKDLLEEVQNKASMIVQETKIAGKLCISIHPLDFLSSSENNYNWRSCHALDGEYRTGNLSYIQDDCTMICYLKGADNVKLPNFPVSVPWNDKKWRMLLYMGPNKDFIFAGRQYPFFSEKALDNIIEVLKLGLGLKPSDFDLKWKHSIITNLTGNDDINYYLNERHLFMNGYLQPITGLVEDQSDRRHYNDLLYSSVYNPYYMTNWKCAYTARPTPIKVGHKCNCIKCGEGNSLCSETMMCLECEITYGKSDLEELSTCPICNSRYLTEDGVWVEEDQTYFCPNCIDNYYSTCECCGEYVSNHHIAYDEKHDEYRCPNCFCNLDIEF